MRYFRFAAISLTLIALAGPATAQTPGPATRLLGVVDGTPRYEPLPNPSHTRNDASLSGLMSVRLLNNRPVGSDSESPLTTGVNGGRRAAIEYLVRFWEQYPNAKGRNPRLGEVWAAPRDGVPQGGFVPPAAARAELDRQATAAWDALKAHPFMQRSEGHVTRAWISYHKDVDASGTEVYGWRLRVNFGILHPTNVRQTADGRWSPTGDAYSQYTINVRSNLGSTLERPSGVHRGYNLVGALYPVVFATGRPAWKDAQQSGPADALYDPARSKTQIQLLTIDVVGRQVLAGTTAPDTPLGRAWGAAFLTDWKALVNRLNGPGAPPAR